MKLVLKIIWSGSAVFALYMLLWMVFFDFLIQSANSDQKFSILNFLIPNIIGVILLINYSKELLIGYKPRNPKRNKLSLVIFGILTTLICVVNFKYYYWHISNSESIISESSIPIIVLLTSFIGLIVNRINNFKFEDQTDIEFIKTHHITTDSFMPVIAFYGKFDASPSTC